MSERDIKLGQLQHLVSRGIVHPAFERIGDACRLQGEPPADAVKAVRDLLNQTEGFDIVSIILASALGPIIAGVHDTRGEDEPQPEDDADEGGEGEGADDEGDDGEEEAGEQGDGADTNDAGTTATADAAAGTTTETAQPTDAEGKVIPTTTPAPAQAPADEPELTPQQKAAATRAKKAAEKADASTDAA